MTTQLSPTLAPFTLTTSDTQKPVTDHIQVTTEGLSIPTAMNTV